MFKKKIKKGRKGKGFWDAEYSEASSFALSMTQSEDLEKFVRWHEKEHGRKYLNVTASVLDLGSGNGRNLVWMAETFGLHGIGYDISSEGVRQSQEYAKANGLPLTYTARSIAGPLNVPDASQTFVLDMMTSHFLKESERAQLIEEIFRVLKPGGFLFYKTFLLNEDKHAKRLLIENPSDEVRTYIHPKIGVPEHVSTENEIEETYGAKFIIHKVYKSHRHKGPDAKRRSVALYLQKPEF